MAGWGARRQPMTDTLCLHPGSRAFCGQPLPSLLPAVGPHCQIYGRVEEVNITVVFLWGDLFRPGLHRWSSIRVLEESWVLFSFSPSLSIGICRCLWDRILWSHWDSQASFFCFPFRLLAVSGGPGFFFLFPLFFPTFLQRIYLLSLNWHLLAPGQGRGRHLVITICGQHFWDTSHTLQAFTFILLFCLSRSSCCTTPIPAWALRELFV